MRAESAGSYLARDSRAAERSIKSFAGPALLFLDGTSHKRGFSLHLPKGGSHENLRTIQIKGTDEDGIICPGDVLLSVVARLCPSRGR